MVTEGQSGGHEANRAILDVIMAVEDTLLAELGRSWFTCNSTALVDRVIGALRSVPVEQRMAVMGMEEATSWTQPLKVHHYDGEWPNHETHTRQCWVERCDARTPGRLAVDK